MWDFRRYENRIAVIDDKENQITYGELLALNREFAMCVSENQSLEETQDRKLVFIICSNQMGCFIGYTACINHHIVPLMLMENMDKGLLMQLIEQYRPQYIWKPKTQSEEMGDVVYEAFDYQLISTGRKGQPKLHEELALLLTTSGSTGSQKLVKISKRNIESNTKSIVNYLELTEEERPILALPMSYTYGLSIINTHLYVGACILLTSKKVMQKSFWDFFRRYEGTSFSGVPHTYEVLEKIHFIKMDLPSLRTLTQAGGKLSRNLQELYGVYAQEHNVKFVVMYGQTEATARISYLPAEQCLSKIGSIGIPIPGGKLSLLDVEGRQITELDVEGELVYQGENVTMGYAQCIEDLAKGDERGGILYTGDMGRIDEDGYFYISGRRDRYIKVFGNRVSLDEIEGMIRTGLGIHEMACVGKDEMVYIFLEDMSKKEEVRDYLAKTTNLNKTAFRVREIESIPRNDAGKIQYKKLNEVIL